MAMLIVLCVAFAPILVLAVIACASGPGSLRVRGDLCAERYNGAECHGVTGGSKAVDLRSRTRKVVAADGRWVIDLV